MQSLKELSVRQLHFAPVFKLKGYLFAVLALHNKQVALNGIARYQPRGMAPQLLALVILTITPFLCTIITLRRS